MAKQFLTDDTAWYDDATLQNTWLIARQPGQVLPLGIVGQVHQTAVVAGGNFILETWDQQTGAVPDPNSVPTSERTRVQVTITVAGLWLLERGAIVDTDPIFAAAIAAAQI